MENISELKNYFQKLLKMIRYESVMTIGAYKLINKQKFDDIICCIFAKLPDTYQKELRRYKLNERFQSIILYNTLTKRLKRKFIFNSKLCLVHTNDTISVITGILYTLEKDIISIQTRADNNICD